MMTLAVRPAARHREVAATFSERVRGARSWDVPAPVAGWCARDVVGHLIEWSSGFLAAGAAIDLAGGPAVDQDPVAAWDAHCAAIQGVLDDPQAGRTMFENPHIGTMPVESAIDRFYTTDVFLHTWDLARATGQDDRLDQEFCAQLLGEMEIQEAMIRRSGQFGVRVPVPADADVQTRLVAFIGRDPAWPDR